MERSPFPTVTGIRLSNILRIRRPTIGEYRFRTSFVTCSKGLGWNLMKNTWHKSARNCAAPSGPVLGDTATVGFTHGYSRCSPPVNKMPQASPCLGISEFNRHVFEFPLLSALRISNRLNSCVMIFHPKTTPLHLSPRAKRSNVNSRGCEPTVARGNDDADPERVVQ